MPLKMKLIKMTDVWQIRKEVSKSGLTFGIAPNSYCGDLNSSMSQMTSRSATVRQPDKNNLISTWFRGMDFNSAAGRKKCSLKLSFSNMFEGLSLTISPFGFSP